MATTQVVTGKVRFCYANVWTPKALEEGGKAKYSVSILIKKSDKVTLKKVRDAIALAKENGKAKFGGKIPANLKDPLRDGDIDRPEDPNYEGCYFLGATSYNAPGIVDKQRNQILDEDEFYSGCVGRASVNFYAFAVPTAKGIACGLNNLQKLGEGERIGAGSTAEEDFADDFEEDELF